MNKEHAEAKLERLSDERIVGAVFRQERRFTNWNWGIVLSSLFPTLAFVPAMFTIQDVTLLKVLLGLNIVLVVINSFFYSLCIRCIMQCSNRWHEAAQYLISR